MAEHAGLGQENVASPALRAADPAEAPTRAHAAVNWFSQRRRRRARPAPTLNGLNDPLTYDPRPTPIPGS